MEQPYTDASCTHPPNRIIGTLNRSNSLLECGGLVRIVTTWEIYGALKVRCRTSFGTSAWRAFRRTKAAVEGAGGQGSGSTPRLRPYDTTEWRQFGLPAPMAA